MQPLEGFYYFTQVVDHGGFARAARALGIPKSRLSRHVVALEAKLNVRLVNRSTRRFVVTDVGHEVYRHATAMLTEADAALEAVEFARAKPCGTIKASCPVALAQSAVALILPEFLEKYPAVLCHDFVVLRAAVLAGLGVARLPESVVREDLVRGVLTRVLPAWNSPQGIVHVVFPSRRGLLPAVRAFIDFLAERLPGVL